MIRVIRGVQKTQTSRTKQNALKFVHPFSAHKYDQKAVKVGIQIFENISFDDPLTSRAPQGGHKIFFDPNKFLFPKNHFNVHKMA